MLSSDAYNFARSWLFSISSPACRDYFASDELQRNLVNDANTGLCRVQSGWE